MTLWDNLAHAAPENEDQPRPRRHPMDDEIKGVGRRPLSADVAALFEDKPVVATDLNELARLYREAEADAKDVAEMARHANARLDNAETALREAIVMCGLASIRNDYGTFTPYSKLRARIPGEYEEEAFAWLEEHDLGSLIQRKVNAQTLSSQVKQLREDGIPVPTCFEVYEQPGLSVTKGRK